ncbi:hypothetical protein AYY17_00955 [Morganella psychrotolerans]|uniref:Uncharacterized protein n=1 Tax=Morganella psychrotolerans TaxID=368603 RepID=A0A1B8HPD4_9GAMM|nr:hypothetical protein AYY17_00955 [Morganella psychrotolerans]
MVILGIIQGGTIKSFFFGTISQIKPVIFCLCDLIRNIFVKIRAIIYTKKEFLLSYFSLFTDK